MKTLPRIVVTLTLLALILTGCGSGGGGVDKNLFATCSDGFKEYDTNCQDVCKTHGGVQQFGLKGAGCASNPPL